MLTCAEFTFTTAGCGKNMRFSPRVADGLLYAVGHGQIPPEVVTTEFVKRTINNRSWVLVMPPSDGSAGDAEDETPALAYPSPVDLCESEEIRREGLRSQCYEAARQVESSPLRCFQLRSVKSASTSIRGVGVPTYSDNDQQLNALECSFAL